MQLQGQALRVIIYIGESDHYGGKALYMALLEFLKREGASGATVTRGLAGFGARSRIHTATVITLSEDLPLRLEWVDLPEVVDRLLPQIRGMVNDGLITVEEVNVAQYAPGRRPDPLSQPVADVMRREVVTVLPHTSVAKVVTLLLQKGYRSLPVVDENGRLQGIITDGDLLRRADLAARLNLQETLSETQLQQQLGRLQQQAGAAADIMSQPVITVKTTDRLRQAMSRMIDHDLKRLPVVDEDGRLAGWVSRVDILRTIEYHQPVAEAGSKMLTQGHTVPQLMIGDVPTVSSQATLEEILQALEVNRSRRAVVIDEKRRVLGIITDGDLLRRSQRARHPNLLQRLRGLITGQALSSPVHLPEAEETAADLMTAPVITVTPDTPIAEVLPLMLRNQLKWLPVVDERERLQGLLGRAGLLRGLLPSDQMA